MELNAIEWNIRGGATFSWNSGYKIKKWVVDEMLKNKPDIIILTEFVIASGWDYLQERMEAANYRWFTSNSTGMNGIFIAVKNREEFSFDEVIKYMNGSVNSNEILEGKCLPDFYEIKIKINNEPLSIIGVRIRKGINTDNNPDYTKKQFNALDKYLSGIKHSVVCMGDFNAYWPGIWNKPEKNWTLPNTAIDKDLYTPLYDPQKSFSYVMPNGQTVSIDHTITNLKKVATAYDWEFLCDENGYKGVVEKDIQKPIGLPDHAILRVILKL